MSTLSEIDKANNKFLHQYCSIVLTSINKKEIGIRDDMKVPNIIEILEKIIPTERQVCINEIVSKINLDVIKEFLRCIVSNQYKIEDISTKQMLFLCMNSLGADTFRDSIWMYVFPCLGETTEINEIALKDMLNTCSKF